VLFKISIKHNSGDLTAVLSSHEFGLSLQQQNTIGEVLNNSRNSHEFGFDSGHSPFIHVPNSIVLCVMRCIEKISSPTLNG